MTRTRKRKKIRKRRTRGGVKKEYKFKRIKPKKRTKEEVDALIKKFEDEHGEGAYNEMSKNPMIFWKKKVEEKKEKAKIKMKEKAEYEALEASILDAIKAERAILRDQSSNRNITQKVTSTIKSIFGRKSKKRRRKKTRKKRRKKKKN